MVGFKKRNYAGLIKAIKKNPNMSDATKQKAIKKLKAKTVGF